MVFGSYQVYTYVYLLDVGSPQDAAYLTNFNAPEQTADFSYRWTKAESSVTLVYPSTPFEITFQAWANWPNGRSVELRLIINDSEVRRFALDTKPRVYTLRSRLIVLNSSSLELIFRPIGVYSDETTNRELGVILDYVEIRQAPSRYGPVIPPLLVLGWWLTLGSTPLLLMLFEFVSVKQALSLSLLTFGAVSLLYIIPVSAYELRTSWLEIGGGVWLIQAVALAWCWNGRNDKIKISLL